jgi:glycosyltransferase involved in cell wall biosynthesis
VLSSAAAAVAVGDYKQRVPEHGPDEIREVSAASDCPALAVSADYRRRVIEDIGIAPDRLVAISPGVPARATISRAEAGEVLARRLGAFDPALPVVAYLGRQDVEKGIDLLLYASCALRRQGYRFQLVIAGPTLFGAGYARVIEQLAENLRLPVIWQRRISDELRDALFAASRMIVYPSIHREPFGMVPVEAAAFRTPSVVPDYGGITEAIRAGDGDAATTCGLTFAAWDSGDLARQMARLLEDDALWQRLADAGPDVAAHHSVAHLADRLLGHLGIGAT